MDLNTERAVDQWLGPPLCALASMVHALRPDRAPGHPPRTVVVMLLSEMGSMVCSQPMWRALKARYPGATLYALVLEKNRAVIDLLGEIPRENVLTISDASPWRFIRESLAMVRRLRRLAVDAVVDCELFARFTALLSFASGAPIRVGFDPLTQEGLYRGRLNNRRVPYNPYVHIAGQYLTLAGALDSAATPPAKAAAPAARPALLPLPLDEPAVGACQTRLRTEYPGLGERPLVLLFPGVGVLTIRGWPVESYALLAMELIGRGYAVAVIGPPEDVPLGERIVAACRHPACINLAGTTRSIADLMPLFEVAELLIGNDGGPCHFAALTRVRILTFFGPETPLLYAPLGRTAATLYQPLACSPCLTAYNHRRTYCDGDNVCLRQIGVPAALEATLQLLSSPRA